MPRKPRKGSIKAIPTLFNGVKYRSRLEARFAEMLTKQAIVFQYEKPFPNSRQGYVPDFYLPSHPLYVEIKPLPLFEELEIFKQDILSSDWPWICVDNDERGSWRVFQWNLTRGSKGVIRMWPAKVEFFDDGFFLYPEMVTVHPEPLIEKYPEEQSSESSVTLPVSMDVARLHFARMREMLRNPKRDNP